VRGSIEETNAKWLKRLAPQELTNIVGAHEFVSSEAGLSSLAWLALQTMVRSDQ
jgi:hypothetical protein